MLILIHPRMNPGWNHDIFLYLEPIRGWIPMNPISCNDPLGVAKQRWLVEITRWGVKDGDLTDGSTTRVTIWQCVKTLYPCSSHQNSWDLWMFIPLKMVLIGIDPYPYDVWLVWHLSQFDGLKESDAHHVWGHFLGTCKCPRSHPRSQGTAACWDCWHQNWHGHFATDQGASHHPMFLVFFLCVFVLKYQVGCERWRFDRWEYNTIWMSCNMAVCQNLVPL